jgi:phospholipid transport system substrate-binding protein
MRLTRRDVLGGALALAGAGMGAARAEALSGEEAKRHVRSAVDAVMEIVQSEGGTADKAARLREVLQDHAAMPQIARFAAGITWREMSESQQERFTDAFLTYVSVVYARRFQDYSGETVTVNGVTDAGRRGLLVESTVSQPEGQPVKVDWLVSDRPGRTVIADIVIEGVSMLVSQREEIGAMLEKRGGDVDKLISDLASA